MNENINETEFMENMQAEDVVAEFADNDQADTQEYESDTQEAEYQNEPQPQYYSLEEIENLSDDDEIDESRLSPALLNLMSKMKKKDKSIDELLEDNKGFEVASKAGLTLDEFLYISNDATQQVKAYLERQNIEFDPYDDKHQELVNVKKNELTERYSETKQAQKAIAKAEAAVKAKYGNDYQAIDNVVMKYLNEELPYNKREQLLAGIRAGNIDLFNSVYDMAAKRLNKGTATKPVNKKPIYPPNSIVSGTKLNTTKKPKSIESNFLFEETKWHSKM